MCIILLQYVLHKDGYGRWPKYVGVTFRPNQYRRREIKFTPLFKFISIFERRNIWIYLNPNAPKVFMYDETSSEICKYNILLRNRRLRFRNLQKGTLYARIRSCASMNLKEYNPRCVYQNLSRPICIEEHAIIRVVVYLSASMKQPRINGGRVENDTLLHLMGTKSPKSVSAWSSKIWSLCPVR